MVAALPTVCGVGGEIEGLICLPIAVVVQAVADLGRGANVGETEQHPVLAGFGSRGADAQKSRRACGPACVLVDAPVAVVIDLIADFGGVRRYRWVDVEAVPLELREAVQIIIDGFIEEATSIFDMGNEPRRITRDQGSLQNVALGFG